MAAELVSLCTEEPTLTRGDSGVFDVKVDGQLIFSKFETGRFPEPGEVLRLLNPSEGPPKDE